MGEGSEGQPSQQPYRDIGCGVSLRTSGWGQRSTIQQDSAGVTLTTGGHCSPTHQLWTGSEVAVHWWHHCSWQSWRTSAEKDGRISWTLKMENTCGWHWGYVKLQLCCLFQLSWCSIMCTCFLQDSSVLFNNCSDLLPSSLSVFFTQKMLLQKPFLLIFCILTAIAAEFIGGFSAPGVSNRSGRSTDIKWEGLYFYITVNKLKRHFAKLSEGKMSMWLEFGHLKTVKSFRTRLHFIVSTLAASLV